MAGLELNFDASGLRELEQLMRAAGKAAPQAIARAVNHTGDKARTAVVRALTTQTGLQRQVIVRAIKPTRAVAGSGAGYVLSSAGGDIRLKFFGPRQVAAGVSAAPHGRRQVFAAAFMFGGRHHDKRIRGGQIFIRLGRSRLPIEAARSGVFIPAEMVEGTSAAAFLGTAERELPPRLAHELLRLLGG